MTKLRLTLALEYEPDPKHYDDPDPASMAALDEAQFQDVEVLLEMLGWFDGTLDTRVEAVP